MIWSSPKSVATVRIGRVRAGGKLRTGYKITVGAGVFVGILIAVLGYPISSIEGIWRSPFHLNCLCSSYDFAEFRNGVITTYSDKHDSAVRVGRYALLDDGRFEVKFDRDPINQAGWIVQPKLLHWFVPIDHSTAGSRPPGSDRLICRLFYRPLSSRRAQQIIAAGPRTNSSSS